MNVKVVDSIHENGAKLVEIKEDEMADFRFSYPGLRIIPEKFYRRAFVRHEIEFKVKKSQVRAGIQLTITDNVKKPVRGNLCSSFYRF
jgi:subtilisin